MKSLPKRYIYNQKSGFTLIEICVALLILFIGVLGVAQLFVASTYSNKFAQNTSIAVKAGKNIVEKLRAINTWTTVTTAAGYDARIQVGGTVLMPNDGGPVATSSSLSAIEKAHISGIYFEAVKDTVTQKILYYDMRETNVGDTNWAKRAFEIRWQIVGYNSSGTVDPGSVSPMINLSNAYSKSSDTPDFASLLSSPTPVKSPTTNEQSSVYVIIRVAPITNDAQYAKRLQFATILTNPS
ncbi:MAG: prepilin-type N-terminal cleavage/methylation domain-containing protein [Acidobacteria bacterium]|nr:prepilin-type N-terminal cleavage/methylation domain-containing protein [Acidobacteriota bacterium]